MISSRKVVSFTLLWDMWLGGRMSVRGEMFLFGDYRTNETKRNIYKGFTKKVL